jgi:hypothetical protein
MSFNVPTAKRAVVDVKTAGVRKRRSRGGGGGGGSRKKKQETRSAVTRLKVFVSKLMLLRASTGAKASLSLEFQDGSFVTYSSDEHRSWKQLADEMDERHGDPQLIGLHLTDKDVDEVTSNTNSSSDSLETELGGNVDRLPLLWKSFKDPKIRKRLVPQIVRRSSQPTLTDSGMRPKVAHRSVDRSLSDSSSNNAFVMNTVSVFENRSDGKRPVSPVVSPPIDEYEEEEDTCLVEMDDAATAQIIDAFDPTGIDLVPVGVLGQLF